MQIGDLLLRCHLLNDGTRAFEMEPDRPRRRAAVPRGKLAAFMSSAPLKEKSRAASLTFRVPGSSRVLHGLRADRLVDASEAFLNARDLGQLAHSDAEHSRQAEILVRTCAREGIAALFDEATGYREHRARLALRHKLLEFVAHDLQGWSRVFPEEFWAELSRLEGIRHRRNHRPIRWGKYVIYFLHDAVARAVDSDRGAPRSGREPRVDLQPWLNEFVAGSLHTYLQRVIEAMRHCESMDEFASRFARVFSSASAQVAMEEMMAPGS